MAVDVIVWFVSEQEVIEPVKADYYKMILMDIQMPVMNGYDAALVIRKMKDTKKARIPIIAMTANAMREDAQRAETSGMNGHLSKPIDYPAMLGLLQRYLGKK